MKVLAITADGGYEDQVKGAIDKVVEEFGRIDVLINNAQASKSGLKLIEHTKEDFDLAINSGLYAVFNFMKFAHQYLKETKGSVINFASGAGLFQGAGIAGGRPWCGGGIVDRIARPSGSDESHAEGIFHCLHGRQRLFLHQL